MKSSQWLNIRRLSLGHFQVGTYRYRSLIEGLYTIREALQTLNSPPVACSFL